MSFRRIVDEEAQMAKIKADRDTDREPPEAADDPLMGQLKSIYDDVAKEPLPSDLLTLLEKLDEAERNR